MAYFKILSRNSNGETAYESITHDNKSPGRDSDLETSEYEDKTLQLHQTTLCNLLKPTQRTEPTPI